MSYFEIPENPDYNDKIEKLTPETRGHADVWNVIYERIIQNIAYIHDAVNVLKGSGDGSITKLITEEVAKIIANAPEDFDTLKEISDWISHHQDSAAAMNTAINKLKEEKLDKTAMAAKSEVLKVERVSTDVNTLPGIHTGMIKEQMKTSANLPTSEYYHVITLEGTDANFATQLAIGMTTTAMFYRNMQNGNWQKWCQIPLLVDKVLQEALIVSQTIRTTGAYRIFGGDKVSMWTDNEGGNIEIVTSAGDAFYQIDACGGVLRIYKHDNNTKTDYFPIKISDTTVAIYKLSVSGEAVIGNFLVYSGGNGIFYIGGSAAKEYSYPHLKITQFSNSLQILPTQPNKCTIGHTQIPFECITSKNIYNSSGIITSSDRNKKKDFADITREFSEQIIDGLLPTSFKYKDGDSDRTHYGLVAQDVEELLEELGIDSKDFAPLIKHYPDKEVENEDGSKTLVTDYDAEPEYYLRYEGFTGLIIKYIQGLRQENTAMKDKMKELEDRLELLESKLNNI